MPEYFTDEHYVQLDYPKEIPIQGKLVFLRNEPHLPKFKKENRSYLLKQTRPSVVLLLDMQEALLGKVTPALRLADGAVDMEQKRLTFYFIYDGEISAMDYQLATLAIQESSVSFPDFQIDAHIERIDYPQ